MQTPNEERFVGVLLDVVHERGDVGSICRAPTRTRTATDVDSADRAPLQSTPSSLRGGHVDDTVFMVWWTY